MVSAWPELPSAKPAEPSAGVYDGQEALALCTSETPPNWRLTHHKSGAEGRRGKAILVDPPARGVPATGLGPRALAMGRAIVTN